MQGMQVRNRHHFCVLIENILTNIFRFPEILFRLLVIFENSWLLDRIGLDPIPSRFDQPSFSTGLPNL